MMIVPCPIKSFLVYASAILRGSPDSKASVCILVRISAVPNSIEPSVELTSNELCVVQIVF